MRAALQHKSRLPANALVGGVVLIGAACLLVGSARADGWATSLAVTSDYVDRGLSQTGGASAVQGGLSWSPRGAWYLGTWASTLDADEAPYGQQGANAEIDLIAGYRQALDSDFSIDVQLVRYVYAGTNAGVDIDYTEIATTLDYRRRLRLSLSYAPDASTVGHYGKRADDPAWTAELTAQWPFFDRAAIAAGVGYRRLDYFGSYAYGSIGLTASLGPVSLALAQHFTDGAARRWFGDEVAGARTAVTAMWQFGQ